uniref:Uncharacterized protein n=1 Tax=Anguilla anguilla TaxID=7936 RepID=A0A0E9VLV6_ANGAN
MVIFLNKHHHQRERAIHCHQDTSVHLYDLIKTLLQAFVVTFDFLPFL